MGTSLDARAKRIIDELSERTAPSGDADVERACAGDADLARRVRDLLRAIRRED